MTLNLKATVKKGRLELAEPVELAEGTPVSVAITPLDEDYDPLDAVIGICETGLPDGAENHDKYLYGSLRPNPRG